MHHRPDSLWQSREAGTILLLTTVQRWELGAESRWDNMFKATQLLTGKAASEPKAWDFPQPARYNRQIKPVVKKRRCSPSSLDG